ncbi:hypothetical protein VTK73DRAFT_5204 [Phialemonium thermophilum]|uniref:Uncharacterized protein n=1 Tax=Phialemonium thermophilum TaxID=223376 RepID=A0ABR3V2Z9_9PEZI
MQQLLVAGQGGFLGGRHREEGGGGEVQVVLAAVGLAGEMAQCGVELLEQQCRLLVGEDVAVSVAASSPSIAHGRSAAAAAAARANGW